MKKYYFYTDPDKLDAQIPTQAFGPQPSLDGHDQYRIVNAHSTTASPEAIAICDGKICIQHDDAGNCSIILKPFYQPSFDFPFIKYFIYKGIDAASLFSANELVGIDDGSSNIPFINRIKSKFEQASQDTTNSANISGLNYKEAYTHSGEQIFQDSKPIDNLFYFQNPDIELPIVRAGEVIGKFGSEVKFLIVLERLGYEPKIELARSRSKDTIKVPTFSRPNPSTNDADYFEHWHAKEECLSYIDPCAFYGSFAESKLFYRTRTGPNLAKQRADTPDEILTGILYKFKNKNRVYLDTRDDFGHSLTYYEDKNAPISFVDNSGAEIWTLSEYDWPITYFTKSDINAAGLMKRDFFKTQFIVNSANSNKLIYLSRAHVNKFKKPKRKQRINQDPLGSQLTLALPLVQNKFLSTYLKYNCYDLSTTANSGRELAPVKDFYLDGLFRPSSMPQSNKLSGKTLGYTLWHQEQLVDLTLQGGPRYVATIGIARDANHITLFAYPEFYLNCGLGVINSIPRGFSGWTNKVEETNEPSLVHMFKNFASQFLSKKTLSINNGADQVDIAVNEHAPYSFTANGLHSREAVEDYCFLIFDHSELDAIATSLDTAPTDGFGAPAYLMHTSHERKFDDGGIHYRKIILDGLGLNKISNTLLPLTIPIGKEVYENADN